MIEGAWPSIETVTKQDPRPRLVPCKKEYAFEATEKSIEILKDAVSLAGVTLVKEVLDVGLAMITTCEACALVDVHIQFDPCQAAVESH